MLIAGGHPYGFQAGVLTLWVNGTKVSVPDPYSDVLPAGAVNVAAMYDALARDIITDDHSAPEFDHARDLTRLLTDVMASAKSGA
jgi:hypothetical protein